MHIKNGVSKRFFLLFIYLILISIIPVSFVFAETGGVVNILKPQVNTNPGNVMFFVDQTGKYNIAFQYQHENEPNDICFIRSHNETWSAPIYLDLESFSNAYLCDIKILNPGTPVMLLLGDNTDYAQMFDVSNISNGDEILEQLDMTEDEFFEMISNNQRLFFCFQLNGEWGQPLAIPGTYGAARANMTAGDDGSALVLFSKDADFNIDTIGDIELYATVYNKASWTKPVRLTNNDKADYSPQAVYVQDEYLVVWASDEDNNIETLNDTLLNYAVIGNDGGIKVNNGVVSYEFQENAIPVLGRDNDKALLMWSSVPISDEDPRRPILACYYGNGWLETRNTGLFNYQMGNGTLHEIDGSLVLIYHEAGTLQAAVNDGDGWSTAGTLINPGNSSLDISNISYYPDDKGDVHIGITGFTPGRETDYENEFDGIYYTKCSLKCDLTVNNLAVTPRKKRIGQAIQLQFDVLNSGYFQSDAFQVLIKENQKASGTLNGERLSSGESRSFIQKVTMDKATMNFELEIITGSTELSKENNVIRFEVKLLPDYTIRSVQRGSNNTITARVIEDKGIAAPPVPVDFYSVIDGKSEKIGSSTYDPIADEPVEITWEGLGSVAGVYQLVAEVNHERRIEEDDYANNKGSFIYNPLPDFIVKNFNTTKDYISVTIENKGEKEVSGIDLLVTDNPEAVSARDINEVFGDLHYYQEIDLENDQTATITITYDKMNELEDKRIYAIVNPEGTVRESDMNNNLQTTLVKLRGTLPESKSTLLFGAVFGYGTTIIATVVNTGNSPVLTPKVELVNSQGIIIAQQIIPVITAHGWKRLSFQGIKKGTYTLRLITNWAGDSPWILETSVTL